MTRTHETTLMGPVYQNWIAPELAVYATDSRWYAAEVGFRWRLRPGTALIADARYDVAQPGETLNNLIGPPPTGERAGWSATLGFVLGNI